MVLPAGQVQLRSGPCHDEVQSCAVGMLCAMAQCTGMLSCAMAQCKLEPTQNVWRRDYTWCWKGAAAEARELISHLEGIRSIFGNPQQFSTLVQGAWSQNTCFQKCLSAGTFILLGHARLGTQGRVSAGLVRAILVSKACREWLQRRGGNVFYRANTAGMGVENLVFIFVNKLIFSEGLTFSAQQWGCVVKCVTVWSLPQTWPYLLKSDQLGKGKFSFPFFFVLTVDSSETRSNGYKKEKKQTFCSRSIVWKHW